MELERKVRAASKSIVEASTVIAGLVIRSRTVDMGDGKNPRKIKDKAWRQGFHGESGDTRKENVGCSIINVGKPEEKSR